MTSHLEKVSPLERKLNIEVPAQEVQAAFHKAFQNIQRNAAIKGFRKGKAPLETIRSLYGDRIHQDVVQDLVQDHYSQALNEHQLTPISYPEIEFDSINTDAPFKFSAVFEVRPEIVINNYENLPVEREKMADLEPKLNEVLANMRTERATLVDITEDRPATNGDVLEIGFTGYVNNEPFEGGQADKMTVELGAGQFIGGFEEGLIGAKKGEHRTLNLQFPEDYNAAHLAGQPVRFEIDVKELKQKQLPELNDEFAKSLGSYESLEAFKNVVRDDIRSSEEKRITGDVQNRLVEALVARNPVAVPKAFLAEQKKALVDDVHKRLESQGLNHDQVHEYIEKWDDDITRSATFMIQSSLLIDALAEKLGLAATDDDFEAKMAEYAQSTGLELSRIKEFYGKADQRSRLSYKITQDKVVGFLLTTAKVTEVDAEKLRKPE